MIKQPLILSLSIIVLVLLLAGGCASDTRNRVLDDTLKIYSSAIRWGDFLGATKFYKDPTLYSNVDIEKLKAVKVTGYDSVGGAFEADGNHLKQIVRIRYYYTDVGKEKEITDNQIWEYSSEREVWLLTSPMPVFD